MTWIDIKGSDIPEGEPLLFQETINKTFHVGFWSEKENCMVEFRGRYPGRRWSVDLWAYIDRPKRR